MLFSKSSIIAQMKLKSGFVFKQLVLSEVGNYGVEDASWNYRDGILHIPFIHMAVKNVPFAVTDEVLCNIFFQKLFGFTFPMVVVDTEPKKRNFQLSFASCFFFCLLIQNSYESVGPGRTKVTTEYQVGMPKYLAWIFPLIRMSLKKNYGLLMSTDLPMRLRRGELRASGFRFASDVEPSYIAASEMVRDNLIPPPSGVPMPLPLELNVRDLTAPKAIGDEHANGYLVRPEVPAGIIRIYQRTCPHEGALLSGDNCSGENVLCPWHGKRLAPLCKLNINGDAAQITHPFDDKLSVNFKTVQGQLTISNQPRADLKPHRALGAENTLHNNDTKAQHTLQ